MDGLFSLLLFGVFAFLLMRGGCGSHAGHGGHHRHQDAEDDSAGNAASPRFVDPVCAMQVSSDQGYVFNHQGFAYHFCSRECLDKFESDPALYLSPDAPPPETAHEGGH